ncbi:MAG: PfkB family carbohydrate kinase, partial [Anaerolineae bacterium]
AVDVLPGVDPYLLGGGVGVVVSAGSNKIRYNTFVNCKGSLNTPGAIGDCYGGAFVVGLLEGWDLARIARFANVVGALAVTRKGPMEGAPTRAEALARM